MGGGGGEGGGPEQRGGGSSVFEPLVRGGSFNFQLPIGGVWVGLVLIQRLAASLKWPIGRKIF